jgi:hypothetical protein
MVEGMACVFAELAAPSHKLFVAEACIRGFYVHDVHMYVGVEWSRM